MVAYDPGQVEATALSSGQFTAFVDNEAPGADVAFTGASLTLPAAGTYMLYYTVMMENQGAGAGAGCVLFDGAGVEIPGTRQFYSDSGSVVQNVSTNIQYTAVASETITLRQAGATGAIRNDAFGASVFGFHQLPTTEVVYSPVMFLLKMLKLCCFRRLDWLVDQHTL